MQRWAMFGFALAGALMLGTAAQASTIGFVNAGTNSGLTLTQIGNVATPSVSFTFAGLQVSQAGDALNGATFNLSGTFDMTGYTSGPN
ncbi:MAG: hypothetical protein ACREIC_22700, partial [Limisphaerales bacterium]